MIVVQAGSILLAGVHCFRAAWSFPLFGMTMLCARV
jgi:hypothetical protein